MWGFQRGSGKGCETNHNEPSTLIWGHGATCWLWNLHLKEHTLCPLSFYLWKDTPVLSRPLGGRTKECLVPKRTPNNLGMITPHSTDWEQIPMCFPQGEKQSGCWELGFLCIWESSAVFVFEGLGGVFNSAIHIKPYTLGGNAGTKPISLHKLGKCSTSSCSKCNK